MAVMVNGGGAGGGGGWINITESVTLGSGKKAKFSYRPNSGSNADKLTIVDDVNGAFVRIDNVEPGERYRITGWKTMWSVYLNENDEVITGQVAMANYDRSDPVDYYGTGYNVDGNISRIDGFPGGGQVTGQRIFGVMEIAIPKYGNPKSLFVFHHAVSIGSTYDDVIVEKYIG